MSTVTTRVGTKYGPAARTVRPALNSTIPSSSAPPGQVEADWARKRSSGGPCIVERASDSAGALRRILIVDDHPVVRAGLAALLTPQKGLRVVAERSEE